MYGQWFVSFTLDHSANFVVRRLDQIDIVEAGSLLPSRDLTEGKAIAMANERKVGHAV